VLQIGCCACSHECCCLLFDSENEGCTVLLNTGGLLLDYIDCTPEDSSCHRQIYCEKVQWNEIAEDGILWWQWRYSEFCARREFWEIFSIYWQLLLRN
jgi:hypothetical protein